MSRRTEADTAVNLWQALLYLAMVASTEVKQPLDTRGWCTFAMIVTLMFSMVAACSVWEQSLGMHEDNNALRWRRR